MKFKNILNKPYKYGFLSKNNKFSKIINKLCNFYKLINFNFTCQLNNHQIFKIYSKFSNTIYKNHTFLTILKNRLDIWLVQIGLCKTIKQSKYIISKGKILINGNLIKTPSKTINKKKNIKIIPFLYNKNFYNNNNLFKNYLLKYTNVINILNSNIININTNVFHIN